MGNITEDGSAGVDTDKLLTPLAEIEVNSEEGAGELEDPGAVADSVPPVGVGVGTPEVAVSEFELSDAVTDASVLCCVLRLGYVADSEAGTVTGGEPDAVPAVEDGDKELLSRLVGLDSAPELAALLADSEGPEEIPPDAGLEVEDDPRLGVTAVTVVGTLVLIVKEVSREVTVADEPAGLELKDNSRLDVTGVTVARMLVLVVKEVSSEVTAVDESGGLEVEDDSGLDVTGVIVVKMSVLVVKEVSREVTVTDESGGLLGTVNEELSSPLEGLVYTLDAVGNELIVQVSTRVVVRSVIWEVDEFVATTVTRLVVMVRGRLNARVAELELATGSGELGPTDEGSAELGFKGEGEDKLGAVEGVSSEDDKRLETEVGSDMDGDGYVLDKSAPCHCTFH